MNCSAASPLGKLNSAGASRACWAVAAHVGAVILCMHGAVGAAAQSLDRYSCTKGLSERIIEIRHPSATTPSCEVWYGAVGDLRRQAVSRNTPGVCERVARNIHKNLTNSGFTCSEPRAREQPGGSADAPRPTFEDEIVQAGQAAVQACLPRLRQVEDECERPPFNVKVVGKANTPMAIGGADVPVLVLQAHWEAGDLPERAGGHYLASLELPATIRAINESYEVFQSLWSADLNDDGRTELMMITHTMPRQGRVTASFAVIGDARTLGYANSFESSGEAHEVYVLQTRTGGYRDIIALTGDTVFDCHYQSGYQCKKLLRLDVETQP